MLSQSQLKHIRSLRVKKYRQESGLFIAEGHKLVSELVNSRFGIEGIYATAEWIGRNKELTTSGKIPVYEVLPHEMEKITALNTPSPVLAVVESPTPYPSPSGEGPGEGLFLALDDIRDPGNMGTILRIADWFGIGRVFCSESCVDLYNPKVVQATMGSIARVRVTVCDLATELPALAGRLDLPVYGAFLEGDSLFETKLTGHGIILIGNESHGISAALEPLVTHKIFIPSYGSAAAGKAESLNASVAAAIICAEFRKQSIITGE